MSGLGVIRTYYSVDFFIMAIDYVSSDYGYGFRVVFFFLSFGHLLWFGFFWSLKVFWIGSFQLFLYRIRCLICAVLFKGVRE